MLRKYISALAAAGIALSLTGCALDDDKVPPIKFMTVLPSESSYHKTEFSASGLSAALIHPASAEASADTAVPDETETPDLLGEIEPAQYNEPNEALPAESSVNTADAVPEVLPPLPPDPQSPDYVRPELTLPTIEPDPLYDPGFTYFAPGSLNPASRIYPKTGAQPRATATKNYILKYMTERITYTGVELGYKGDWCALLLSDLLQYLGYDIYRATNPCDLAITLMNNDYARFVCLREENYESLIHYGLKDTSLIKRYAREDYVPQRGDLVIFRWDDAGDEINWSHIGIVAEDYDGKTLKTLEGNTDLDEDNENPGTRYIFPREREYDRTVVGFIKLK